MSYVSVRALSTDGKAMVYVEPNTTVAELKAKIQEAMEVSARSQVLVYRGRDLKNAQTIDDCNYDPNTSILLFDASRDIASVAPAGSSSSNLGNAGYALGLLVRGGSSYCCILLLGVAALFARVVIRCCCCSFSAGTYTVAGGVATAAVLAEVCS